MVVKSSIMWVFALEAEAKSIIREFDLKLIHGTKPFRLFRNEKGSQWLIISGIGSINAAAATVYLHQFSNASLSSFWFNVGIAGYSSGSLGDLFLVDKITDEATGKNHFPRPMFKKKIKKGELLTVSRVNKNLPDGKLVDMEGYSFFDVISRFSYREMIAVIKLVSDNLESDHSLVTPKFAGELISDSLAVLRQLILEAENLSKNEYKRLQSSDSQKKVFSKFCFTETNKKMVEKLIRDWELAFPSMSLLNEISHLKDSAKVVKKLKGDLADFKIDWS